MPWNVAGKCGISRVAIWSSDMGLLKEIITHKLARLALAGAVVALAVLLAAWEAGFDRAAMVALWAQFERFVGDHPGILFAALVILPGLPFPVSALLFVAGVTWRENPLGGCALSIAALSLNMTWTYWVAAGPGRRLIERLIRLSSIKLPDLPRKDHLRLILVLRLTPGIPLFFQNYVLGCMRPPFRLYLLLSIVINGVFSSGFVLVGAGASDGRFAPAVTGIALVVVAVVLTRWLRSWLERRRPAGEGDSAEGV